MKKQRLTLVFVVLLSLMAVAQASALDWPLTPKYSLKYIVDEHVTMLNKKVRTAGVVTDSQVLYPTPGVPYRSRFVLQDPVRGTRIPVLSHGLPPANGSELKSFSAIVQVNEQGLPVPIIDDLISPIVLVQHPVKLWYYGALGGLIILAIVLLILLLRSPSQPAQAIEEVLCPHCGASNDPMAHICERCGERMDGSLSAHAAPLTYPPAPATTVSCPVCGTDAPFGSSHCERCGARLHGAASSTEPVATMISEVVEQRPGSTLTQIIAPEDEPVPIAHLVIVESPGTRVGTRLGLRGGRQLIGRDPEKAEILLRDETVSREHAMIFQESGVFYLQDQFSTAGTLVNGQKISREALADGDEITLGKTKLVFHSTPKQD